ncbi:MAG: hypothetical protein EA381_01970 [Planctomycetaceae bacterium]|nr:MAG: hypothetical protein EA381_01970 [Planctomycetaceae bacterium]
MIRMAVLGPLLIGAVWVGGALFAGEPSGPLVGFGNERTWSDQSGRFEVPASMIHADRQEVRLRKSDGKVVTVPVDKLSTGDRRFVESFLTAEAALMGAGAAKPDPDNPFAGGAPEPASRPRAGTGRPSPAALRSAGRVPSRAAESPAKIVGRLPVREPVLQGFRPLSVTPDEAFWSAVKPTAVPAVELDDIVIRTELRKPFFASMRVLAASQSGTVLLNSYQQGRGSREDFSNFVIVDAGSGDVSPLFAFDQPWKALAISHDASRVAAVRVEGFDKGNDLAIFHIADMRLTPEFQFKAGGGAWDELHWAAFLPDGKLATISQKHDLTFWDLDAEPGPRALYRGHSGGSLSAEISAAGDLIVLPFGSSIAAIETDSGKLVGCITRDQASTRIAISPSGQRIAAFHPFTVTLHDTADGKETGSIAVAEGNPQATVRWIGDALMVGKVLYDVETGMPLWTYNSQASSQIAVADSLVSAFGGDDESVVVVSRLPHDEPLRRAKEADPSQIYAIVPGDDVTVRYEIDDVPTEVQAAIRAGVEQNLMRVGWNLVAESPNTITIKLERGEQEEVEYFTRRGFGPIFAPPGFRPDGPSEKVQIKAWIHSLRIDSHGGEVFTGKLVRGAPQSLQTREDEKTQAAVDRIVQPNPNYFRDLVIPPRVLKPEFRDGLGKSTIERSGIR